MNSFIEGATVDGHPWKIHYQVSGKGADLLLLHGGGPGATGQSNYSKNIQALEKAYRVWVIDLPGWGRSSKNLNTFGDIGPFQNGARAVLAFMDAIGITRAHIVGNSLGGSVALCLAMEQPERVDRLILMGPGGGIVPGATGPTEGIMQLQNYYQGEGPTLEKLTAFIGNLVYDGMLITPELIRQRFEASIDPDICANPPIVPRPGGPGKETFISRDPRLASLHNRTLFIWGLQDKVNPPGAIESFKSIPNADYVLLNNCGHWAQWEHPDRFNDLVQSFLRYA
jgi:pimeloyl-ACP methyl ester carboxylesterase